MQPEGLIGYLLELFIVCCLLVLIVGFFSRHDMGSLGVIGGLVTCVLTICMCFVSPPLAAFL